MPAFSTSALALPLESDQFDLVICRHVLQAVPDAPKAVAEMVRVARPGGRLHLLAEDYGMLWCHPTPHDADGFWQRLPQIFARAIGCDNHIGRKMFTVLTDRGLDDIAVEYVVVDTVTRASRHVRAHLGRPGATGTPTRSRNTPASRERSWTSAGAR